MRIAPVAVLALVLAPALALPPAHAHDPYACATDRPFPSADMRLWRPGDRLVYYVPAGQLITVTSAGPIDVSMALFAACDSTGCDVHGATGVTICAAERTSIVEIANRGAEQVLVNLAIGVCVTSQMCDAMWLA